MADSVEKQVEILDKLKDSRDGKIKQVQKCNYLSSLVTDERESVMQKSNGTYEQQMRN